jgi:hypothetical protein
LDYLKLAANLARSEALLYEMGELSRAVFHERFPTDTATAEKLWRFSNRSEIPADLAARFLESLGYEPFQGFPLQRRKRATGN